MYHDVMSFWGCTPPSIKSFGQYYENKKPDGMGMIALLGALNPLMLSCMRHT